MEKLQTIEIIPFRTFKEKIKLTKEYEKICKVIVVDNKYILTWRMRNE